MIRIAEINDFLPLPCDECAVRIYALMLAYGIDVPFVRYYADGCGNLLSIMDGVGIFHCRELTDEWLYFIDMNPDIARIHCSAEIGRQLCNNGRQGREGVVLKYAGDYTVPSYNVQEQPYLPSVYALLSVCFDELPSLNSWYPDVSHRIRHNCAQIACVMDGSNIVSVAMTVAETDTAALLGHVATHPDFRGQGYAKSCINSLISRCKGKSLYIIPKNNFARSLYESMGFIPCGEWAELSRI